MTIEDAKDCPVCDECCVVVFEDTAMNTEEEIAWVLFCRFCHYEETTMRPRDESRTRSINAAVRCWNRRIGK